MAEENTQVSEPQPSLDDVYKQYNVDSVVQDFAKPAPQQEPQRASAPVIPDAVTDSEAHKNFLLNHVQDTQALRTTLQQTAAEINQWKQERAKAKEEADIKQAVDLVNETLKADPDMVEIALGQKARKDPRFMNLWMQRDQKPDAWKAAVKAYTVELEKKFQFRADPQLTENQRAMKTAQQAMATGSKEPSTD